MTLEAVSVKTVPTGAESTKMKPITEGKRFVAEDSGQGFWAGLVDTASNSIDTIAGAYANREINRINGAAATENTTGDIADQVGGTRATANQASFFDKNKTVLMVGGGALLAVAVVIALKK